MACVDYIDPAVPKKRLFNFITHSLTHSIMNHLEGHLAPYDFQHGSQAFHRCKPQHTSCDCKIEMDFVIIKFAKVFDEVCDKHQALN